MKWFAFLLSILATPVLAEKADRDKPTQVEANKMTADDVRRLNVFEGDVVVTKGTIRLTADRLVVRQDAEGFQLATATGKPARFRQRQDAKPGEKEGIWVEGEALRIELDDRNQKIELFDKARVNRGGDEVAGDYIFVDQRSDFYQVSSGKGGEKQGRVKAIIQSKPPAGEMSELRSQRLRKRYKSRTVVQDVSLEVSSGEVVGLLGPNGAGKTTCFYMIVGLIPVDAGSIHLDSRELTHLPIHRRARLGISYLPQENSVFRRLTVEENVQAILELQGLASDEIESRLAELLKDLNIAHLRHHSAISLSGGERRRLEIARALGTRPAFILLDEPFAGVDPIAVLDIQRIIRFLKERGIGVLITDHNVRETLGICDRAYIINEGAVLASGHPEEIVYNDSVRRVYLGENFRM